VLVQQLLCGSQVAVRGDHYTSLALIHIQTQGRQAAHNQ
jgi:hypothetical protein